MIIATLLVAAALIAWLIVGAERIKARGPEVSDTPQAQAYQTLFNSFSRPTREEPASCVKEEK